jgi:hypothetical protein
MMSAANSWRLIALAILLPGSAITMATLAGMTAESGTRAVVTVVAAFCLLIAAILVRNLLAILLFALCIALAYNRQFYSFDEWIGDYGSLGLFWTPADALMLSLMLAALARRGMGWGVLPAPPRYLSVEIPMLLLIAVMAISTLRTDPLAPAMFETLRIAKYLVYFLVLRAIMDRDLARVVLIGLATMVLLQFALGAVQVALGAGGSGLSALDQQTGEMAHRATGTTGHPNMYAPFLLMPTIGFIAMGASGRKLWAHRIALGLGVAGAIAIVLSQSRAPIAALFVAPIGVGAMFVARGVAPAPRIIGSAVICATIGMVAAAPLAGKILDRLTGDLEGSINFRGDYNDAAIGIWRLAPMLGVGPSGFMPALPDFHPDYARISDEIQPLRKIANVRAIAPVHNVYLWILAETGVVGLGAFGLFLGGAASLFHQAGRGPRLEHRFFIGVFWGFLGLCAVQLMDFSLWWDHQLMALTVLMALAAFLRDEARAS